ncbi:MAG TPA: pyridoxamine 5'-phosphate oxidase family protein [Dehalococcoidia bacterium]|nr:pyridoxamine 5'-phosphate oxidase family protein [Dehalococcoidia bacterium]
MCDGREPIIAAGTEFDAEITATVKEAVWAFLATAGGRQPHVRVVHPVWEGRAVWIATRSGSAKVRQLARNPRAELFYWTHAGKHLTVTGACVLAAAASEKARLWALFKEDPIAGYDPALIWKGPDDPNLALLRLDPRRIEAFNTPELAQGIKPRLWRAQG